ncbi:ATP-grasp domain-containing protein [Alkalilimnicola sp. S0819]|uniref:ATP-grasp domain-containing protein n=1 Tax=Alkalilimnicola sp. S0819 TaxID=2613922 RepID=UPI001261E899|nr:ATP-grasp domain-containing protein [Alkalilimnicola sp. S0819]KAB7619642.1 ATP-grasp domain-containing protein [Alkalilimnicola sp. S0819]MPQ17580.1 ATP-grasp domain-containing protein [Alkalilimnicola sp. S0819]
MPRNVFVLGMRDWQRAELESIDHAEEHRFHGLLDHQTLVCSHAPFDELLAACRAHLAAFRGAIDAVICHWDYPSSCLAPVLAADYGLPGPSLEAVLRCEHKYWARLEQLKAVPECVPAFQALNPFDPHAADKLVLNYPFWLKPVKGFSSQLGFHIESRHQLEEALGRTRAHIATLGRPFNQTLALADLPKRVARVDGLYCLAESFMSGVQAAPEGYARNGQVFIHGIIDMLKDPAGHSFTEYRYPSRLPETIQAHMIDVCKRLIAAIGFDQGCFNVEFLWDEARDKLWLVEVNPRISQSHSDLFLKVDGMSNHEIAVAVALGRAPRFRRAGGRYKAAGMFMLNKYGDAEILRVPHPEELEALAREFPDAHLMLEAREGIRLSELPNQDAYRYVVGEASIGGEDDADLQAKFQRLLARAPFEFSDHRPLNQ